MSQITLTFPDDQQTRIINGICKDMGYSATLEDGSPNPETKAQFAKRVIIERIKNMVTSGELKEAEEAIQVDQTELNIT